jgi:integrase
MPSIDFNKRVIDRLPAPDPSGKQVLYFDKGQRGFGVLVSGTTATKTFIVQRKIKGSQNARRISIDRTDVITLDVARERAIKLLAELGAGIDPREERRVTARRALTLGNALDGYLASRKDNLAAKTRHDYRATVERYLADWMELPLRQITPEMVEAKHEAIAAAVAKRNAGGRSGGGPATGAHSANGTMRVFRILYNFATERDATLPANPVRRLRRAWFPEHRRERLVRLDELPKFYAAVDALDSRTAADYLKLLLFTGLRRNEAAALKWSEVDFAERIIKLPAARTKGKRKLDLPMSSFVRDLLVARRALGVEGPFVFAADSRSGHIEEPKFPLNQIALATGIRVSAHDLRRSYITVAESADISPLALKALVNHSLGGDVTSGYVQMTAERLREPAQKVADRLMALCGVVQEGGPEIKKLTR